ncbi:unnamed protein product, partial [Choristocarpus tenellus]
MAVVDQECGHGCQSVQPGVTEGNKPSKCLKLDTIDKAVVLEATGESCLTSVEQLILRGRGFKRFEKSCSSELLGLTVLSLSNNSIRSLDNFEHLINLVELNLNFNYITSLEGLSCLGLTRLFLSNNLLTSTDGLATFQRLHTICLFKNAIPDLPSALKHLRTLVRLRRLDLDGNPCSKACGYKQRVLRSFPRLETLDSEHITQLDLDLSKLYFEQ